MMIYPVADGHCDYLYGVLHSGYSMESRQREQAMWLPDMQAGHVALQFFACWIDTKLRTPPLQQCITMIDAYERMLAAHPEFTPLTRDFEPDSGKIATVLTVEGGEAVEGSMAVLRVLHRLGVRAMTLTWNETNELAGAAMARNKKGLTPVGRDIIDEMCRIGIAIDVSHLSDSGIDDVLARSTRPIFASHSNARGVYHAPRSLEDAHIRAIAQSGGTIGVNFYYEQLGPRRKACIDDIVQHICHIVKIGGIGCCAIGSDFDGMQQYPVDIKTSRDFPALFDALRAVGFQDAEIRKIAYENLHDYILKFI